MTANHGGGWGRLSLLAYMRARVWKEPAVLPRSVPTAPRAGLEPPGGCAMRRSRHLPDHAQRVMPPRPRPGQITLEREEIAPSGALRLYDRQNGSRPVVTATSG